ncbi:hypothetical protein BU14_0941s0001 [Porphyra umbilicalis]|uniref:Uncharacterized protein n=1 Tax=Porphyra umbilicalis TaxID=2786 RepID=A0A1X6NN43_PORUM|nr:hypothetical protein BU14_0941s0001 [Porphyra umbilicalis]|eukprot:OSX70041.1 hypothetical protein BU14_0941s0001 [Porphyra umbilicalis]
MPPSRATPGTAPAAVAAPAFGRFVLDEAAGELVALRPERRGSGLFCLAITGAGVGHGGSAGAAHRCMVHLDGAGATGVPDGPITVQRRTALCCGAGWAAVAASVPTVGLVPAAATAAAPTPPWTSPADFHGFDTAVRRLLGGVAARRGDPTAAAVAVPPPLAGQCGHGGPRRSGGGCLWPPLSAAAAVLKPAALHRLPPAVGAGMEVALVQAALDVVVERPWWSAAAVAGEEADAPAARAAAAAADAAAATAAAVVAAADATTQAWAAAEAAAVVAAAAGAATRPPWAAPLYPTVGSPISPPRLAPRPAGHSALLADASACRPSPALPPRGRVKRRPHGASPGAASDAGAATAGAAPAAADGRPSSRVARNRAAAARANAVRAAARAARRAARAAAAGTSAVGERRRWGGALVGGWL